MKPGLNEKIYERALIIELQSRGRLVDCQKQFEVFCRGEKVGLFQPDLILDSVVGVETKVANAFHASHIAQIPGYLAITEHGHHRTWRWSVDQFLSTKTQMETGCQMTMDILSDPYQSA